ncbi:MAG: AmmeMemoRadiSam system protein B [Micromonosporaceae bacterium]
MSDRPIAGHGPLTGGVRPAAVAGRFYPGDPAQLSTLVDRLMSEVDVPDDDPLAAGYVVPHAGYRFSGPVAAHAYARLRRHAGAVTRVVLVGPSHFVRLDGCAVPTVDSWATPLGEVRLDAELRGSLLSAGLYVVADDDPHQREHSLEVQLPFLIRALGDDIAVLPIGVGACPVDDVVAVIETAVAEGALLVCSTDFSHYHDQATAQRLDARTAGAVTGLQPEAIGVRDACGVFALRGTVGWAREAKLTPELLDLRTSADTAGGPDRVVGYPAFAIR